MPAIPTAYRPVLKLTSGATTIELQALADNVGSDISQDKDTVTVFGLSTDTKPLTYTDYGAAASTIPVQFYPVFGTGENMTVLRAMEGLVVDFEFTPQAGVAISASNPKTSGQVRVPALPPLVTAQPGKKVPITITFDVQGTPTHAIV